VIIDTHILNLKETSSIQTVTSKLIGCLFHHVINDCIGDELAML